MERLRGADAFFVYMETPTTHLHIGFVGVLDTEGMTEPYSFEHMLGVVEERLHLFPPFRRSLATVPLSLHHPVWIDAEDFDLERHVRRAALPPPGGKSELAAFAGEVMSRPLDRAAPLWEMWFVEGIEDGRVAMVAKAHHSIVDGVGGTDMLMSLLDLEPDRQVPPPEQPWRPEPRPSDAALLVAAVGDLARQPGRMARVARRAATEAVGAGRGIRRSSGPAFTPAQSRTFLNATISPHRSIAFAEFALDDARAVKRALGGTVNDVVLAACGGALHRYLLAHGEPLSGPLVASVPVSVRTEDDRGELGNRLAGLIVPLATDVDDPVERLHAITDATQRAKEIQTGVAAHVMTEWTEFAMPLVAGRAFRFLSRNRLMERVPPLFNVSISNIPGPPVPLYVAGARLVSMYPMGPVMDGNALNMTVVSSEGTMFVGLIACRETVPDLDALAAAVPAEVAGLVKASRDATTSATSP
jgi:diacylglycerol O-acyltransferase